MKLENGFPLRTVSVGIYLEDKKDRAIRLNALIVGGDYTVRLITNPIERDEYATDFSVILHEIVRPKKRLIRLSPDVVKVVLKPISADGDVQRKVRPLPIREDGILYSSSRKMHDPEAEVGYFVGGFDETDAAIQAILAYDTRSPLYT